MQEGLWFQYCKDSKEYLAVTKTNLSGIIIIVKTQSIVFNPSLFKDKSIKDLLLGWPGNFLNILKIQIRSLRIY